jgi:hypothetical protein
MRKTLFQALLPALSRLAHAQERTSPGWTSKFGVVGAGGTTKDKQDVDLTVSSVADPASHGPFLKLHLLGYEFSYLKVFSSLSNQALHRP